MHLGCGFSIHFRLYHVGRSSSGAISHVILYIVLSFALMHRYICVIMYDMCYLYQYVYVKALPFCNHVHITR